ncbi:MAG TPA: hypothetical protein VFH80_28305 [Solirubrobacteraceae bacterium]|nr:hypothetical protein [Solirubrobacteraceae bacterium]
MPGETVTRLRATAGVDPYSGATLGHDWTSPASLDIKGCAVWPLSSVDVAALDRDETATDLQVAFPAHSDVLAGDRVVIRGLTYVVVGDPFDFQSPFTDWHPGLVATARKVTG